MERRTQAILTDKVWLSFWHALLCAWSRRRACAQNSRRCWRCGRHGFAFGKSDLFFCIALTCAGLLYLAGKASTGSSVCAAHTGDCQGLFQSMPHTTAG